MNIATQKEHYQELLREAEGKGNIETGGGHPGRGSHPRFKTDDTEMEINVSLKVSVINISLSGVCFFSDHRFQPGQMFDFKVGSVFSIQAEVTSCEMVETDAELMEVRFRVESNFIGQELGLHSILSIIEG